MKTFRKLNPWTINLLLIVLFISIPIFVIYLGLYGGSSPTWDHIATHLLSQYLVNTFWLVLGTIALTLIFGTVSAWLVAAHDFPGRRLFNWGLVLPLTIPTYIAAYAYSGFFEFTGPLFTLLRNSFGFDAVGINVKNIPGTILVFSSVLFPYVFIAARASFLVDSGRLYEAARTLGSSPFENFRRIVLPVSRPAIIAGLSLVVMEVLNEYGAVKYYNVNTFTTGIFRAWFSLEDLQAAIYLAAILMTFIFVLIVSERLQRGKRRFQGASTDIPPTRYQLTGWTSIGASLFCFIPVVLGFLLPVFQMLYWASFTMSRVLSEDFFLLISNSFFLSLTAAICCVIVALLISYAIRLSQSTRSELYGRLATMGYSIPGAALAVGIVMTALFVDRELFQRLNISNGLLITGSLFGLIYAYVIRYLAVSYSPIDGGFNKISFRLTEVARTLGVGPLRSLFLVNLPLLKPALWSALLLVFVDVMKELPLTLILRPFNFETLATRAFRYANDEMVPESAPVSLVIIATALIPILILDRNINKKD